MRLTLLLLVLLAAAAATPTLATHSRGGISMVIQTSVSYDEPEWGKFVWPEIRRNNGSYSVTFYVYAARDKASVDGLLTGAYSGWTLATRHSLYAPDDPWTAGPAFMIYGPLERRSDGSVIEWIRFAQCDGIEWEQDSTNKYLWKRYCIIQLPEKQIYSFTLTARQVGQYEYEVVAEIEGKRIVAIVKDSGDALQRIVNYMTSYSARNALVSPGPPLPETTRVYAGVAPLMVTLPVLEGYRYEVSPSGVSFRVEDAPGPFMLLRLWVDPGDLEPVTYKRCLQTTTTTRTVTGYAGGRWTTLTFTSEGCAFWETGTSGFRGQLEILAYDGSGQLAARAVLEAPGEGSGVPLPGLPGGGFAEAALAIAIFMLVAVVYVAVARR